MTQKTRRILDAEAHVAECERDVEAARKRYEAAQAAMEGPDLQAYQVELDQAKAELEAIQQSLEPPDLAAARDALLQAAADKDLAGLQASQAALAALKPPEIPGMPDLLDSYDQMLKALEKQAPPDILASYQAVMAAAQIGDISGMTAAQANLEALISQHGLNLPPQQVPMPPEVAKAQQAMTAGAVQVQKAMEDAVPPELVAAREKVRKCQEALLREDELERSNLELLRLELEAAEQRLATAQQKLDLLVAAQV